MPYLIILKVRKFYQPTLNRLGTARQKQCLPRLNRVKDGVFTKLEYSLYLAGKRAIPSVQDFFFRKLTYICTPDNVNMIQLYRDLHKIIDAASKHLQFYPSMIIIQCSTVYLDLHNFLPVGISHINEYQISS